MWPFKKRERDPLELEVEEVAAHPRDCRNANHAGRLCVGHVVDWLRAERDDDPDRARALLRYARLPDGLHQRAAYSAAAIARIDSPPDWEATSIGNFGHFGTHLDAYGVNYHAQVAGFMAPDELPVCERTYRTLLDRSPEDYAAIANVAEIERRHGNRKRALALARRGLALADDPKRMWVGSDLGRANNPVAWRFQLACLCARIEGTTDERSRTYLAWANGDDFHRITAEIRPDPHKTTAAAHAAFGSAGYEARIWLRVALLVVSHWTIQPPFYHPDPGEYDATLERLSEAAVTARSRMGPGAW